MHDLADLESRGVPGVFAASREFTTAAQAQSEALGFPAAAVFVDHPVQDRSDEEMRALADAALPALLAALSATTGQPTGTGPGRG